MPSALVPPLELLLLPELSLSASANCDCTIIIWLCNCCTLACFSSSVRVESFWACWICCCNCLICFSSFCTVVSLLELLESEDELPLAELLELLELLELEDELLPMLRVTPALLLVLLVLLEASDLASSEMLTVSPESELLEPPVLTLSELLLLLDMELMVTPLEELASFNVDARFE